MEYWEFEFFGKNSEDLHGVELRERIRKIAYNLKINGVVKNLKASGTVKVTCSVSNSEEANNFFSEILSIKQSLIRIDEIKSKKTKVVYEPPENVSPFKDFNIERADELSEMVWALLGAGRVFSSTEKVREKNRRKNLGRSLKYGVSDISDCASDLQTNVNSKRKFVLLSVDNYIKECPLKDEDLMENLYDLHNFCEQANALSNPGIPAPDRAILNDFLGKILKICPQIDEKLGKA